MGNLISCSLMASTMRMRQLLNRSLARIIKGGVKNDENVNITKRKNKNKKKKNKNKKKKKKQHNNHDDTETPAPTLPALYRYPELDSEREGAGQGNWGTQTDEIAQTDEEANETENDSSDEEPDVEDAADGNKESSATEYEEKEPETKWYTMEEFSKLLVESEALFKEGMKWNEFWTKPETE